MKNIKFLLIVFLVIFSSNTIVLGRTSSGYLMTKELPSKKSIDLPCINNNDRAPLSDVHLHFNVLLNEKSTLNNDEPPGGDPGDIPPQTSLVVSILIL
ncbi:MAG: hypothetical protein ACTSW1_12000 [Candidatus Hodarchaeales archaeon]